jgi:hypothetical protein
MLPSIRKQTITTEQLPLVGAVSANFCEQRSVMWSTQWVSKVVALGFIDWGCEFFIQVSS